MRRSDEGFTLIEFLFLVSIISMVFTAAAPGCLQARSKAKEAQVKSACHTIQIALERYATDHSGKYPKHIYGGDRRGWSPDIIDGNNYGCIGVANAPQQPKDPLIFYGYMESYPDNAFIDPGKGRTSIILWTGGTDALGYGDPRFGYTGEIMGNCLNDPRYLWNGPNDLSSEQYMIYDWEGTRDKNIAMVHPDSIINPFYSMGGIPKPGSEGAESSPSKRNTLLAHWPGQFFYRSGGDFFIAKRDNLAMAQLKYIWDWPYARINRYILGGYGSRTTEGLDVIRLTTEDGSVANNIKGFIDDYYVTHGEFINDNGKPKFKISMSTPEVFGGGVYGTLPAFPYWTNSNRQWLYGAPDGYKDGIIITLISGSDSRMFE